MQANPPNRRAIDALIDAIAGDRPEWFEDANCRGLPTDWWFPEPGKNATTAKKVCGECAVRDECLTFALAHGVISTNESYRRTAIERGGKDPDDVQVVRRVAR